MGQGVLFGGWPEIARTLVVGASAYVALVVLVRISGKRTLSKLNAFDLVVTVALGSTLASILTSRTISLSQGLTALALLVGLQFAVTWLSIRSERLNRLVKAAPSVVLHRGEPQRDVMRRERITEEDLLAAIRSRGGLHLSDAEAVILQTDGSLVAVLKR